MFSFQGCDFSSQSCVVLQFPFIGGAGCVSYNFSSNGTGSILTLADADAQIDDNYPGNAPPIDYATCSSSNCTSTRTIALNATSGHYFFNISNPSANYVWVAVNYSTYPANSSGEACI